MPSTCPQNCAEAPNQVLTCTHCLHRTVKHIPLWGKGFLKIGLKKNTASGSLSFRKGSHINSRRFGGKRQHRASLLPPVPVLSPCAGFTVLQTHPHSQLCWDKTATLGSSHPAVAAANALCTSLSLSTPLL